VVRRSCGRHPRQECPKCRLFTVTNTDFTENFHCNYIALLRDRFANDFVAIQNKQFEDNVDLLRFVRNVDDRSMFVAVSRDRKLHDINVITVTTFGANFSFHVEQMYFPA